jgi:peroxiredoxin
MKFNFAFVRRVLSFLAIISLALPIIATASPLRVGDTPKLIVDELSGSSFDLSQEHGKWVLIHFFASWCPGCKTEMPAIVKLYGDHHQNKFAMLALSPEPRRQKKEVIDFMKPYPIPAALVADAKVNDFGSAVALPTTYLLNPNGQIQLVFTPEDKQTALDIPAISRLLSH